MLAAQIRSPRAYTLIVVEYVPLGSKVPSLSPNVFGSPEGDSAQRADDDDEGDPEDLGVTVGKGAGIGG